MHLRVPHGLDERERAPERVLVLARETDDDVGREVEVVERLELCAVLGRRVTPPHCTQHAVVAGLQRDVQVRTRHRRLAERGYELVGQVVDLDRREPESLDAGDPAGLTEEEREPVARLAVAEAAEIHAREDDLAVALPDPATNLGEHGLRSPAACPTTHERDHTEGAREGAAVLDLDERARPFQPWAGLHAPDRAHVTGDRLRCLLA